MTAPMLHEKLEPRLRELVRSASTSVDLVSPFLGTPTATMLATIARTSPARWRMLTNLDASAVARAVLSCPGLRALHDAGVELLHVDRLHAKVCVVDAGVALVGSANLTSRGLGSSSRSNVELSIAVAGAAATDAARTVESWASAASPISRADLDHAEQIAATLRVPMPRPLPVIRSTGEPLELLIDAAEDLLVESQTRKVWVKAVYGDGADRPMADDSFLGSSKAGKPSFSVGDLLVIYYKAPSVCCRVVEVTGPTVNDVELQLRHGIPAEDAERWPWVTPITERLHVPSSEGVHLTEFGLTGQSLQRGHCAMPTGGLALFLRTLVDATED